MMLKSTLRIKVEQKFLLKKRRGYSAYRFQGTGIPVCE